MNVVGAFMWVSVGATALHYWQGYMADHDQLVVVHERTVSENYHISNTFWKIKTTNHNNFSKKKKTQISGRFGTWFIVCSFRSFVRS